jgi:hypothetical protein
MEEIAKQIGQIAVGALIEAIQQGKSRAQALDDAAAAVRRSDVVSDELWQELEDYIVATKDFEDHGAG